MAQLEPWEKVYINLRGGSIEELDKHFELRSCVDCHGGDNTKPNNQELAHAGLVLDPSETLDGDNVCAECHDGITETFANSMHQQLWGEKKWVALRSGVNSFDQCPQSTQEGWQKDCYSCHATCGDCHVAVPNSAGGGFPKFKNHRFYKTPDQEDNCTACHGSRIGHDFENDVHSEMFFNCMDCHSKEEMHAAVEEGTDRYHYDLLPTCDESGCHEVDGELETVNNYHSTHYDDMSCYVCHSQPYNNCTSCHVGVEAYGSDYEVVEDFKIGLNPLETTGDQRSEYKYVTLRHIPIDPESYANWGPESESLPDYDKYPTWKYTTPHNIQRFTARTDTSGGKQCWESCHTKEGFGDPENAKYFLSRDFIQQNWPEEVEANENVVVDGPIPD